MNGYGMGASAPQAMNVGLKSRANDADCSGMRSQAERARAASRQSCRKVKIASNPYPAIETTTTNPTISMVRTCGAALTMSRHSALIAKTPLAARIIKSL
jgi:hypothetical protein